MPNTVNAYAEMPDAESALTLTTNPPSKEEERNILRILELATHQHLKISPTMNEGSEPLLRISRIMRGVIVQLLRASAVVVEEVDMGK